MCLKLWIFIFIMAKFISMYLPLPFPKFIPMSLALPMPVHMPITESVPIYLPLYV